MGWYRTKHIIISKPYLIDPYRTINLTEAKKLWRKDKYPSDESLIAIAQTISGKTAEEWNSYFPMEKNLLNILNKLRYRFRFNKPLFIMPIVSIILLIFFTLTSPGQALAKGVYDTISKLYKICYISVQLRQVPQKF